MKQEIIILGDVEMGAGTVTDDFISDAALSKLVRSLAKKKHPVDLVFNGDTFDFLKAPVFRKGVPRSPRHITAPISLEKLHLIHEAHPRVFAALRLFVKSKRNRAFFVVGNHDPDLHFRKVRRALRKILGSKRNVKVVDRYKNGSVRAEHGHEHDILNKSIFRKRFLRYKGKKILNMPFVSFSVISRMNRVKRENPLMERIKSIRTLFRVHSPIKEKVRFNSVVYFILSFLYFPFRYLFDPTYKTPFYLIPEAFGRLRATNFTIPELIDTFRKVLKRPEGVYVLGHLHQKKVLKKGRAVFIHSDTWRDEYVLDEKSGLLTVKPKFYVRVLRDKLQQTWKIVEVPIKRSVWKFSDVAKNEFKYLELARKEEKYTYGQPVKSKAA